MAKMFSLDYFQYIRLNKHVHNTITSYHHANSYATKCAIETRIFIIKSYFKFSIATNLF